MFGKPARTRETLDFNDLSVRLKVMRRVMPLIEILKVIPGIASAAPAVVTESLDAKQVDRRRAIILSMTSDERSNPEIIDGPRRTRIALGSGSTPDAVSALILDLYEMRRG